MKVISESMIGRFSKLVAIRVQAEGHQQPEAIFVSMPSLLT